MRRLLAWILTFWPHDPNIDTARDARVLDWWDGVNWNDLPAEEQARLVQIIRDSRGDWS